MIKCKPCMAALVQDEKTAPGLEDYDLIAQKHRGGLILPSLGVLEQIKYAEKAFRVMIAGKDADQVCNIKLIPETLMALSRSCAPRRKALFPTLDQHDIETYAPEHDLHSTQLSKKIVELYVQIRVKAHAEHFNREYIEGRKAGTRQKLNKITLFGNL